jgi:hypothetical protein
MRKVMDRSNVLVELDLLQEKQTNRLLYIFSNLGNKCNGMKRGRIDLHPALASVISW